MAKSDGAGMPKGPERSLLSLLRESGDALEASSPPFNADAAASRLGEAARAHGLLRPGGMPQDNLAVTGAELEEEAPPFDVETGTARLREAARARGLLSSGTSEDSAEQANQVSEVPALGQAELDRLIQENEAELDRLIQENEELRTLAEALRGGKPAGPLSEPKPITPFDVRNKQFSTTRLRPGYDEEEVDAFLDEVEAERDRLIQENEELRAKLAEALRGGKPAGPLSEPKPDMTGRMLNTEDTMDTTGRVPSPAQQTADQANSDARREADETIARARRQVREMLTRARRQAEQITGDSRARAESLERDAQERHRQRMGSLVQDREELERRVDDLRALEREYRSRLKAYLEGQLRDLEAGATASGLDMGPGPERRVDDLRALEGEYRSRLKAYLEGQLRDLEAGATSAPPQLALDDYGPGDPGYEEPLDDESWYQELRRSAPAYPLRSVGPQGLGGPERQVGTTATACVNCDSSLTAGDAYCGNCGQAVIAAERARDTEITATHEGSTSVDSGSRGQDDMPRGYHGPTVCAAACITHRQLDHWARTGLVEPSVRADRGSGSQRLYSFRDVLMLKVVKRLLDTGISLEQIRAAVQHLRGRGTADLAQVTLMSDGVSIYECTSPDEMVHLLQGGQGVFGIALGRVWQEVEGDLAALPGGRAEDRPSPRPVQRTSLRFALPGITAHYL